MTIRIEPAPIEPAPEPAPDPSAASGDVGATAAPAPDEAFSAAAEPSTGARAAAGLAEEEPPPSGPYAPPAPEQDPAGGDGGEGFFEWYGDSECGEPETVVRWDRGRPYIILWDPNPFPSEAYPGQQIGLTVSATDRDHYSVTVDGVTVTDDDMVSDAFDPPVWEFPGGQSLIGSVLNPNGFAALYTAGVPGAANVGDDIIQVRIDNQPLPMNPPPTIPGDSRDDGTSLTTRTIRVRVPFVIQVQEVGVLKQVASQWHQAVVFRVRDQFGQPLSGVAIHAVHDIICELGGQHLADVQLTEYATSGGDGSFTIDFLVRNYQSQIGHAATYRMAIQAEDGAFQNDAMLVFRAKVINGRDDGREVIHRVVIDQDPEETWTYEEISHDYND